MLKRLSIDNQITEEIAIYYLKTLLELCGKYELEQNIVDHLSLSMLPLLAPSEGTTPEVNEKLFEKVVPIVKDAIKNSETSANCYSAVLLCVNHIISVMLDHKKFGPAVIELLTLIEGVVVNISNQVLIIAKKIATDKNEQFDLAQILQKIQVLTIWLRMSTGVFEKCRHGNMVVGHYVYSQGVVNILIPTIQIIFMVGKQTTDTIISCTGNPHIDSALNKIKAKGLQLANLILAYIYTTKLSEKSNTTPFYNFCGQIAPLILLTLLTMCSTNYDQLDKILSEGKYNELIVGMLRIYVNMLSDNNFYHFFSANKAKLIVDIIVILLKTTNQEKTDMISDPQNFFNLSLDTCDKQSSEVPRTEAAKLLEEICDHIDGGLTFVAYFCCEAIRYAGKGWSREEVKSNAVLGSFIESGSKILTVNSAEEITEICLTTMTIISYSTVSRKDLFKLYEKVLIEVFSMVFDTPSFLIRCRAALMLGYYAESLFQQDHGLFIRIMEFLVKGLGVEASEKSFSLLCADSLKSIIADPDSISRIEPFINRLFPYLAGMVAKMDSPTCFGLLMTIINSYAEAIDASILQLLDSLVSRIHTEYAALRAKGEKNNMIMNQCWNAIRCICENNAFYPEFTSSIEHALLPVFEYLTNPTDIEFDDDLIQIITTLIRKGKSVSENMVKILPVLPKVFEKNKGTLGSLLQTINAYVFYGKTIFLEHKEYIELFLNIAQIVLFTQELPVEHNNTEGAILLQILLQNLGGQAMDSYIPNICNTIVKRLIAPPSADYLTRQLYNAVLCSVCNNGPLTLNSLGTNLEFVVQGIINMSKSYKEQYDRKVLTIGLSNMLVHGNLPGFTEKFFPQIIDVIVTTLQITNAEKSKKLQKVDNEIANVEDGDSSSSESENEDEDEKKSMETGEKNNK